MSHFVLKMKVMVCVTHVAQADLLPWRPCLLYEDLLWAWHFIKAQDTLLQTKSNIKKEIIDYVESLQIFGFCFFEFQHSFRNTVEPRFSERQPSWNPRISGNFSDDQIFIFKFCRPRYSGINFCPISKKNKGESDFFGCCFSGTITCF